ncbi:hypothetical protein GDO78_018578 [Eleutherodactylus coqui]|uniref:Uncharacterized protein n=1 Tax=Eleutherodactylus coqui TaxID=57060 RepID=A0A8J6B720_ELECQ|nr:hypothetical protein GDO78_018578 [Eleutherodactylus coqui]
MAFIIFQASPFITFIVSSFHINDPDGAQFSAPHTDISFGYSARVNDHLSVRCPTIMSPLPTDLIYLGRDPLQTAFL